MPRESNIDFLRRIAKELRADSKKFYAAAAPAGSAGNFRGAEKQRVYNYASDLAHTALTADDRAYNLQNKPIKFRKRGDVVGPKWHNELPNWFSRSPKNKP